MSIVGLIEIAAAARARGMSEAMLMAVVGLANRTNRLASGLRVPVDPQFK